MVATGERRAAEPDAAGRRDETIQGWGPTHVAARLSAQVWGEINLLLQQARPQWVTKEAILGPVIFRLPMLDFDNAAVTVANLRMWGGR